MRIPKALLLSLLSLPFAFAENEDISQTNSSQSLMWGTYRPNLYFGLRPRLPQSLMTGLMWFGTHNFESFSKTRHACDQGDKLRTYIWSEHDLRDGGVQTLDDPENNLILTTQWLKVPGGEHGGSWAARIKGHKSDYGKPLRTSVVFYATIEGLGALDLENDEAPNGLDGPVTLTGSSPDLGDFTIRIEDGPSNTPTVDGSRAGDFEDKVGKTYFAGIPVPPGQHWKAKELIMKDIFYANEPIIKQYQGNPPPPDPAFVMSLSNEVYSGSNLYAIQKMFDGEFSFDIYYESASAKQKLDASTITEGIQAFQKSFWRRFEKTFPVPAEWHWYRTGVEAFSTAITSNLFGGIGYFYGTSIEDRSSVEEVDDDEDTVSSERSQGRPIVTEPRELLTATPSRSFFPRGFYWDEGFHLLLIGEWDNDLSLEILKSWIDLIDENGWVGREQILGEEARSKVPEEFQIQYPTYANPPTLTMAVTAYIARLRARGDAFADQLGFQQNSQQLPLTNSDTGAPASTMHLLNEDAAQGYIRSIYPALKRHYDWFRRTQRGQIKQWSRKARSRTEAYRWRGRTEDHVLTSGLDDYPRAKPPHDGELHLDLISWMGFFTRTMIDIADYAGEVDDVAEFREIEKGILENIEDLHWSEKDKMYCDVSVNEEEESYHVCHKGYVSLFPFLLGLLPPSSPHLGAILDLLRSPQHLWSPYGIRSLSAAHPLFGKGENYWRGPIWVQMNYLALSALHKTYAAQPGPYQARARKIYTELRDNLVKNVYTQYRKTGYVWEQYDALDGEGRRSHPFTGWTSLITLILSEKY